MGLPTCVRASVLPFLEYKACIENIDETASPIGSLDILEQCQWRELGDGNNCKVDIRPADNMRCIVEILGSKLVAYIRF
jgi:hypothetical protein